MGQFRLVGYNRANRIGLITGDDEPMVPLDALGNRFRLTAPHSGRTIKIAYINCHN